MRAYLPAYDIKAPKNIAEVLTLLDREPGTWRPFAGGTDLMVLFEAGKLSHKKFVNIWGLKELQGIEVADDHVKIGALTTYSQIQAHPTLKTDYPMLCRAAFETGAIAIQNRGTVGGNIANASPAADTPPALLTYGCEVELVSTLGSRWVKYEDFHTGYKTTVMQSNELVKAVKLTAPAKGSTHYYRKVGTRKAQAISKVCFAGLARLQGGRLSDVRMTLGSVAPTALRCVKTESVLRGQVLNAALVQRARLVLAAEVSPIDDIRSTREYRVNVTLNLLEEFLRHVELDQQT